MYKTLKRALLTTVAVLSAGLITAAQVQAGAIVSCGAAFCSSGFAVMFNGVEAGGGEFLYDAKTGDIALSTSNIKGDGVVTDGGIMWTMGDGSTMSVESLSGNADPILAFALAATTGATGSTFGFTFNLPVALSGAIYADSSVGYSLTASTAAGAQISGLGGNKVVTAYEVDTSVNGLGSFNKGVDVGDTLAFTGVGTQVASSTATNSFTGNLAYDLMAVNVNFALSAESRAGITGHVQQTAVPVPAAVWLFGSGLLGLVGMARRKIS